MKLAVGDRQAGSVILEGDLRAGEVAGRTVLGRNAEDVAAGGEQSALAVGGQGEIDLAGRIAIADRALDLGHVRAKARIVVRQAHPNLGHGLAGEVEPIQLAALLEGDGVPAQGGKST